MSASERAPILRSSAALAVALLAIACGPERGGVEACEERARLCGRPSSETCVESRARAVREGCAEQFDALMRCELEAGCDGDAEHCPDELNAVVRSCDRTYAPGEQPAIVQ